MIQRERKLVSQHSYTQGRKGKNTEDSIFVISASSKTMARIHNAFFLFQFYFQCALSLDTYHGKYFTDGLVKLFFSKEV